MRVFWTRRRTPSPRELKLLVTDIVSCSDAQWAIKKREKEIVYSCQYIRNLAFDQAVYILPQVSPKLGSSPSPWRRGGRQWGRSLASAAAKCRRAGGGDYRFSGPSLRRQSSSSFYIHVFWKKIPTVVPCKPVTNGFSFKHGALDHQETRPGIPTAVAAVAAVTAATAATTPTEGTLPPNGVSSDHRLLFSIILHMRRSPA